MPYPQIEDSLTTIVPIKKGKQQVLLQEWPFEAGMRFFRLLKNVLKTVREDYDREGLADLQITHPVFDAEGQPVMEPELDAEGNPTGEMKQKTQVDIAFVIQLAETVSATMDDNSGLMLDCVDAAIVQQENALTSDALRKLHFGDVIALFKAAITINFQGGSSLGDCLKGLFAANSSNSSTTPRTAASSPAPAPRQVPIAPATTPQSPPAQT